MTASAPQSLVYRVGSNDFHVQATNGGASAPVLNIRDWSIPSEGLSAWGPWIAFSGFKRGAMSNLDIAIAHRDSLGVAREYVATSFNEGEPAISPDGKWLAYSSNENGRLDVWVSAFPVAAGRYLVSTAGGRTPHWSRDSRTLYFTNESSVFAASFTPGSPATIGAARTLYSRDPWGTFSISPDGLTMMMTDRVREGEPQALVVNVKGVGSR